MELPRKVLILGSWALKIWEAWEFDYSGSQAIKALKEDNIETVLINPNIATVQTDPWFASKVYFLPVTAHFVEQVIKKEKPDGIFLSFWWQTALNCWLELEKKWVLKKNKVAVLWTPSKVIELTEDRKKFNEQLSKIWIKFPKSRACTNIKDSIKSAKEVGYPVMVRAAFALWWQGSWFAHNEKQLKTLLSKSFSYSNQVLVEENLTGWKEIEYEVVRDANDNCITVCNMENFDPIWIHTWESIVIAPSQTLSNKDYHILRSVAIKTIKHLWIVWECNIQYAYNTHSCEYRVIEVNARLSRSSALASKATGYPLAYVAAKIWIWYKLTEIENSITKVTQACFEPALDYVVLKYPRWDLQKFEKVSQEIWSEMKSVWEVMAIGRNIEEVFQKAIRSLEIWANGFCVNRQYLEFSEKELTNPTPRRIFSISKALKNWMSVDKIHKLTGIDLFFLEKLNNITETKYALRDGKKLSKELIMRAKKHGFSDKQIALVRWKKPLEIRKKRLEYWIIPYIKQIDTLAAEFPAKTNYLYMTYDWSEHDIPLCNQPSTNKILVLWSWSYRIGSSVEFDWCSVNTLKTLRKLGYETIMLNYNPETVSTDFDMCDKLYFEEISLEKILDIYDFEKPSWVIISMGWQVANNLAIDLKKAGVNVLWTDPDNIDRAEDRNKFSKLLDRHEVKQPIWSQLTSLSEAKKFSKEVEYPVLIRPSYVLSWANMRVCADEKQLVAFLKKVGDISKEHPAVISKFETNAREIEIDWVAQNWNLIIYAITEHVENAWVHSWDATVVLPPQNLYLETIRRIKVIMKQIIKELVITWPFNIQFLAKNNKIKVIECNLRASRSFPFVSKTTRYNFIEIATKAILWMNVYWRYNTIDLDYVWVKAPQFSFSRLKWADPKLWVEMASTWEVACFWKNIETAFLKSYLSVWMKFPQKNILVSIGWLEDKVSILKTVKHLQENWYNIFTTPWTHEVFTDWWLKTKIVYPFSSKKRNNLTSLFEKRAFDFVVNTPSDKWLKELSDGYHIRRKSVDFAIPLLNNVKVAKQFFKAMLECKKTDWLWIHDYDHYQ